MQIASAHLAFALTIGTASVAFGQAAIVPATSQTSAPAPDTGLSPEAAKLVADFKSDDFHLRDQAAKKILDYPEARRALESYASKKETELGERAAEILKLMDWGVRPETPPEILALLHKAHPVILQMHEDKIVEDERDFVSLASKLRREAKEARETLLESCFNTGDERIMLYLIIDDAKKSGDEPKFGNFEWTLQKRAVKFISKGEIEKAVALYERVMMLETGDLGQQRYAMLMHTLGKTQNAIAAWSKRAQEKGVTGERARRVLAELQFMAGDASGAIATSEALKLDHEFLLLRAGRWEALARALEKPAQNYQRSRMGQRIICLDFAGKHDEAAALAKRSVSLYSDDSWDAANLMVPLLFAGRIDEAALVAREQRDRVAPVLIYEWAGRYKQGMVLLNGYDDDDRSKYDLKPPLVRLTFKMGRAEEARAMIKKDLDDQNFNSNFVESVADMGDTDGVDQLLAATLRDDAAFEFPATMDHIEDAYGRNGFQNGFPTAIAKGIIAAFPEEKNEAVVRLLRQFLKGKCDAKTAERIKSAAVRLVEKATGGEYRPDDFSVEKFRMLQALGATREAEALAKGAAADDVEDGFHAIYAGILEGKGKLTEAAVEYRAAMEETNDDVVSAYRLSCVLKKLGDDDDAKQWLNRAKLLPAARCFYYAYLAQAMHQAGDLEGAMAQARMSLRSGGMSRYTADFIAPIFKEAKAHEDLLFLWQLVAADELPKVDHIYYYTRIRIVETRIGMAEAYLALGDKPKALHSLELAAKISEADKSFADRVKQLRTEAGLK